VGEASFGDGHSDRLFSIYRKTGLDQVEAALTALR
jgi:hypothetical protein